MKMSISTIPMMNRPNEYGRINGIQAEAAADRLNRTIVRSSGRLLALFGVLAVALATAASVQAGSHGHGHRARRAVSGIAGRWSHLIWSDNFNGSAVTTPSPSRWSFDTGGNGWGNGELQYYTTKSANAELDARGHLLIRARKEAYTGPDGVKRNYTSTRLQTLHEFQFKYGLAEARIKIPAGQGLHPAFWMLGDNTYEPGGWPEGGEIDTMEVLGSTPHVVHGTLHGPWPWVGNEVSSSVHARSSLASGFHVYGVEWEPERISFLLDGSAYETITPKDLPAGAAWPFRHPFFLLLDLAVGGAWPGPPSLSTPFPATMIVDWVRVWQ